MKVLAQLALAILLSGCASEIYWKPSRLPAKDGPPTEASVWRMPCGIDPLGCYDWNTHTIYLRADLSGPLLECVRSHEIRHAQGYSHDKRSTFYYDCGNGRQMVAR